MKNHVGLMLVGGLFAGASLAQAQPPRDFGGGPPESAETFVSRLLKFDKNGDGKLTRSELSDPRLQRLFARADTDNDGTVTKEELTALFAKEQANNFDGFPGGGPGGFGPPGGGPGGPGGFGGPPRPGVVLPPMYRQALELTDEQIQQIDALQKEVDARLAKILTDAQRKTLADMRDRGPRGPGGSRSGPDGPPGGRPGPGGPPPGGPPQP
jgi:hypothetical protein